MSDRGREFGPVIAERRLHPRGAPQRTVVVSLGKPRRMKGTEDWECPFRIAGAGIRRVDHGCGIDAFQALTMALEGIRYFLDRSSTPLVWSGVFEDQTGFQRLIPLMPEGANTRRMERLIDRETQRWANGLKRRHQVRARHRRTRQSAASGASPVRTRS